MRLLLWSPNGSGLGYGGPGMTAYRLFVRHQSRNLEIDLVHGRRDQEQYDLFQNQFYLCSTKSSINSTFDMFNQWLFINKGQKWLVDNHQNYDVFYGLQGFHATVLPAVEAEKNGLPTILKLVQYKSDLVDKSGIKKVFNAPKKRRELINKLSAIVSISSLITHELLEIGVPEKKIFQIPNGVDRSLFFPGKIGDKGAMKASLGWKNLPTIIFVGAVVRRKQPHLLLDVLVALKKYGVEAQLVIAGPEKDPSYSIEMRSQIELHDIGSRVVWHGFSPQVSKLYQAADAYCLLSKNEGMANSLLEAMASGLPSVVTPVSGVSDLIVSGNNGFVVSENPAEIADVFASIFKDNSLRSEIAHNCVKTIDSGFSSESVYQRQIELFQNVSSGSL